MTEWIKHDGDSCPVHPDTDVDVQFKGGSVSQGLAKCWYWRTQMSPWQDAWEIDCYRIVKAHPDCPSIKESEFINASIKESLLKRADELFNQNQAEEPQWAVCAYSGVWWMVSNGITEFKASNLEDAQWLVDKLNGKIDA